MIILSSGRILGKGVMQPSSEIWGLPQARCSPSSLTRKRRQEKVCKKQTPFPWSLPTCPTRGAGEVLEGAGLPSSLSTQRPELGVFTNPEVSALG